MPKQIKKIGSILSTVLVCFVALCAIFLLGTRLLGFQVFTVLTGSMEPAYKVGDLIYVKKLSPNEVQIGDPITFVADEKLTVATHRVVAIDTEKQCFYTKGDTNDTVDPPVLFKNLIGVPKFRIPLLGYVSEYIQNPPGMYITIAGCTVLILLVFLPDMIGAKNKNPTEEEKP